MQERTEGDRRADGLQLASEGVGPLLQRDYWCVIRECRYRPSELISFVRRRFDRLPPAELARFQPAERPLELGDEVEIALPGAGRVGVRVVHLTPCSFTVGTLRGHPIAGRITFGAYRNARGDVLFHIRSRSRSASRLKHLGHLLVGEPMQSTTWTDFLDRLAHMVGKGVVGTIHDETSRVAEQSERPDEPLGPTYHALAE